MIILIYAKLVRLITIKLLKLVKLVLQIVLVVMQMDVLFVIMDILRMVQIIVSRVLMGKDGFQGHTHAELAYLNTIVRDVMKM